MVFTRLPPTVTLRRAACACRRLAHRLQPANTAPAFRRNARRFMASPPLSLCDSGYYNLERDARSKTKLQTEIEMNAIPPVGAVYDRAQFTGLGNRGRS